MSAFFETIRQTPYWLQFMFAGKMYSTTYTMTVPPNGDAFIQIKTAGTQIVHLIDRIYQTESNDITMDFIEGPTLTDGTTPINITRLQRQIAIPAEVQLFSDPTAITGGTTLGEVKLVDGIEWKSKEFEMILEKNENYLIKATNSLGSAVEVAIFLVWYESGN
jgi:hypothetical protein